MYLKKALSGIEKFFFFGVSYAHFAKLNTNEKKTSKSQLNSQHCQDLVRCQKNYQKKIFFPWTLEIIQFIRFENHMNGPRYLKKNLGYDINYLSICLVFYWIWLFHCQKYVEIRICYLNHTFSSHLTGANKQIVIFYNIQLFDNFLFLFYIFYIF